MASLLTQFFEELKRNRIYLGDFPTKGHRIQPTHLSTWKDLESSMADARITGRNGNSTTAFPHLNLKSRGLASYRNIAEQMKDSYWNDPDNYAKLLGETPEEKEQDKERRKTLALNKAAKILVDNLIKNGVNNCAVSENDILIPIYNRVGKAEYTLQLAEKIHEELFNAGINTYVSDCLTAAPREKGRSETNGEKKTEVEIDVVNITDNLSKTFDIIKQTDDDPNEVMIWLVDNTSTRGVTYNNIVMALRKKGIKNKIAPLTFTLSKSARIDFNDDINAYFVKRKSETITKEKYILVKTKEDNEYHRFVYIPFLQRYQANDSGKVSFSTIYNNRGAKAKINELVLVGNKYYCRDDVAEEKFGVIIDKSEDSFEGVFEKEGDKKELVNKNGINEIFGNLMYGTIRAPSEVEKEIEDSLPVVEFKPFDYEDPADAIISEYRREEQEAKQRELDKAKEEELAKQWAKQQQLKQQAEKKEKENHDKAASLIESLPLRGDSKNLWYYLKFREDFNEIIRNKRGQIIVGKKEQNRDETLHDLLTNAKVLQNCHSIEDVEKHLLYLSGSQYGGLRRCYNQIADALAKNTEYFRYSRTDDFNLNQYLQGYSFYKQLSRYLSTHESTKKELEQYNFSLDELK